MFCCAFNVYKLQFSSLTICEHTCANYNKDKEDCLKIYPIMDMYMPKTFMALIRLT
jgi:hypothetical protein